MIEDENFNLYIRMKSGREYLFEVSGTVSIKTGRYYVSVLIETKEKYQVNSNEGIGIDLGLKDFAIISNGITKKNINKTKNVKKLEKKLRREQRKLSRKYESLKVRNKNIKKEGDKIMIKKSVYPKTIKIDSIKNTYTITEKLDGSNFWEWIL